MAGIDESELLQIFLSEAEEHLATLTGGISALENAPEGDALMDDLFRAAHTLKGAAALVKLTTTSSIAHRMEDILEDIKNGKLRARQPIIELLLFMLGTITEAISEISKGRPEPMEIERQVSRRIDEVLTSTDQEQAHPGPAGPGPAAVPEQGRTVPERRAGIGRRKEDVDFFTGNFVKVDIRKVEDMLNLIAEVTIKKNYLLQRTRDAGEVSEEILYAGNKLLKEVRNFSERGPIALPGTARYVDPLFSDFGELEFDRYDEHDLFLRKLQELTNDLSEALKELSLLFESFHEDVKSIDSVMRLLRYDITDTRMLEIGRLFRRFTIPVREVARQHGKQVELLITGGETKIDRVVFERLFDPLMHIIRNAISHGIEKPEDRLRGGKRPEGAIHLNARREGSVIVIEVRDDGGGIDTDRLREEGVRRGHFGPDDRPAKEELLSLIFNIGFSTHQGVDMTSGRGVGMSAVRRQVAGINGLIEVDSEVEQGTLFRIKVPTSLAITNVVIFSCGPIEFVIPINFIEEVVELDDSYQSDGLHETIFYRGRTIHARDLTHLFSLPAEALNAGRYVMVCNISDKKVALIADRILGQEETIVKPLNRFLEGLSTYSGITISGNGRVRLVIDPIRLFEADLEPVTGPPVGVEDFEGRRVLVVDDSLSVRRYVTTLLSDRDLKVYTAANGLDALRLLDEIPVDLVITDLEMPVMHGYELTSRIRTSERLRNLPVVVLTSRSTEKHREKAFEVGSDDYLVKPFDEESLMSVVGKHLPSAVPRQS